MIKLKPTTLFIALALITIFFSCNSGDQNSEIKTIDSLCIILKQTDSLLTTVIPENKAEDIRVEIKEDLEIVSNSLDSINEEQAELLNKYSTVESQMQTFLESSAQLKHEIEYSNKQLTALKTDLVNGVIEQEYFKQYLVNEANEVDKIKKNADNLMQLTSEKIKTYDALNPVILQLKQKAEEDTLN